MINIATNPYSLINSEIVFIKPPMDNLSVIKQYIINPLKYDKIPMVKLDKNKVMLY